MYWVKEVRNIVHTIKIRNANWIGHIVRRNRLLKHVTKGKIGGGGYKWLEDKEEDVSSYRMALRKREDTGNWKKEALDRILWRTWFGKGYGPDIRHYGMIITICRMGLENKAHRILTPALHVSAKLHAPAVLLQGKGVKYPLDRRRCGPHSRSARCGKSWSRDRKTPIFTETATLGKTKEMPYFLPPRTQCRTRLLRLSRNK
jgi:hypothetical protein